MTMTHANQVLRALAGRSSPPVVEIFDKSYSREWMANFYNGCDAFASLTRAEAWGLPISEAILCGRPVVTTRDWAMAEYLPSDYAYFVAGERQPLARSKNPFGAGWCERHREPGNEYFEPFVADARAQLRAVVADPETAQLHAERARAHLLGAFHPHRIQEILERTLRELLEGHKPASAGDLLDAGSRGG
jgi:glycosyltransferase involved in cell wall biosynthesis